MITDYVPKEKVVAGKEAVLHPGEYEITSYTEDGPAHSEKWIECETRTRGLIIASAYETLNVVVDTEDKQHIVVIAKAEDVYIDR